MSPLGLGRRAPRVVAALIAGLLTLLAASRGARAAAPASLGPARLVLVSVVGPIDDTTLRAVERAAAFARASDARVLLLDVDSAGGPLPAVLATSDAIAAAGLPTEVYVASQAAGDAVLLPLAATRLMMAPGARLGPADPPLGSDASLEHAAFVAAAARAGGRDALLIRALADPGVDLPHLKPAGVPLVLSAPTAVRAGIADGIAPSLAVEVATLAGGDTVVRDGYTPVELAVRLATTPAGSGILLAFGLLGLLLELRTLAGIGAGVGAAAFALFAATHVAAGYASPALLWLAFAGLAAIVFELHVVPGHGFIGVLGAIALGVAVVLAFGPGEVLVAVEAIALAVVLAGLAFAPSSKAFPRNAFALRMGFADMQGAEYVAGRDRSALLHRTGVAATPLRPAGTARFDGEAVDVQTEGAFVPVGEPVVVVRVEGPRVFVRGSGT